MTETELLQAFRNDRSEEVFAELVRRYAGLVYSVAKRRLANLTLAEDVTQLVFIRLAKAAPKVRSGGELAAWLHRTTINVIIDTWRSEARRHNREQQAVAMESPEVDNARWEQIAPKLDEALNELQEKDRQALLLRFFEEKSMRDIGVALGVSEDAAKMRVSRAVEQLRTLLGVRGVACTAVALGALLVENSIEAAPGQLISKLSAIRLPAAAVGSAGRFAWLAGRWSLKLAAAVVVLALLGVAVVRRVGPSARAATEVARNPQGVEVGTATEAVRTQHVPSRDSNPIEVRAAKATKILLHVLDSETGIGLADARVRSAFFGVGGHGESHDVLTDRIGDAEIQEPDDPTKNIGPNVFVIAEGHVPKVIGFRGKVPAEYTLKLDPGMTVGGTVVDERRMPVAGVQIEIEGPGSKTGQLENIDFQLCPVTNRADGTWNCSYIPRASDQIRFILKKPGYAVTFPVVPVSQVNVTNLMLVIVRGSAITGKITDQQNYPVSGARVKILNGNFSKRQSTQTDENGVFTLTGVAGDVQDGVGYQELPLETNDNGSVVIRGRVAQGPSHADLAVQAEGFSSSSSTVDLLAETNTANFRLSPGNIFRGRVIDEAGRPIPYAVVQTDYDFGRQVFAKFDWTTHTDRAGRFEWKSAPTEEIAYWFEADGYEVIRGICLRADGSEHEITLRTRE